MTKSQELNAKADQFAARAAGARDRTQRNTFRSLEQSCRTLADHEAQTRQVESTQPASAN